MKTIRKISHSESRVSCAYYNTLSKLYKPHTFKELNIIHVRNKYSIFADSIIEVWDWKTRNILYRFAAKIKKESFKRKSTYEDNFCLTKRF